MDFQIREAGYLAFYLAASLVRTEDPPGLARALPPDPQRWEREVEGVAAKISQVLHSDFGIRETTELALRLAASIVEEK